MREPLTPVEESVYYFLLDHLAQHTFQPSVRDIGRHCRIASTKSVTDVLGALEAKGYIERVPGRSRGVKLVGHQGPSGVLPVPVVRFSGGQPAPEAPAHLALDRSLVPSAECFLVSITDDEARALGAQAGDYVIVHPVARSRDGEAVVVRIGDRAVVRTMVRRGQTVVMHSGNGSPPEELGPQDDFAVLGVLAGVIRPPVPAGTAATHSN